VDHQEKGEPGGRGDRGAKGRKRKMVLDGSTLDACEEFGRAIPKTPIAKRSIAVRGKSAQFRYYAKKTLPQGATTDHIPIERKPEKNRTEKETGHRG